MYDLVADIESYPEFLPWCGGAGIVSHDEKQVVASIKIAYHKIHKTFTTRNVLQPGASMEMQLVEGPFRHLHGLWRFDALDSRSSRISLDIEFDFSNRVVALALGPVFGNIANTLVESFRQRAVAVYGGRAWQG
jgi:ribosome-associated toxin RatA of RatAB toxin-antitoxin module